MDIIITLLFGLVGMIAILAAIAAVPIIIVVKIIRSHRRHENQAALITGIQNAGFGTYYVDWNGTSGIAIDSKSRRMCFASPQITVVQFAEICSADLLENAEPVNRTSSSNLVGRVAIGSVLLGPIGAIIGGLSADKKSQTTISRIDLKINVDNLMQPLHYVNFLAEQLDRNSEQCLHALKNAQKWSAIIQQVIRKNAEDRK